ncbi:MAG: hypothetical protein FJ390_08575, partial [Verrucomicrobia bacterium]|nr:hypothetical protein [Verrucomicrobiota bacterium]
MSDIHSAAISPLTIDSTFDNVDSRPGSPMIATEQTIRERTAKSSITCIDSTSDPNASLKFDIRAHSAEVKEAYTRALAGKASWHRQIEQAEKQTHIYSFKQRAVLFKAVSNAQSKFRIFSKFAQLEKYHLDYLDALSKSSLSPHEQHEKYAKFKQAIEKAKTDACYADSFSRNVQLGSTTLGSKFNKKFVPLASAAVKTAIESEATVQKLSKELQQTESAKFSSASLPKVTPSSPTDEEAFKVAYAAVLAEISRLNSQGPPQLRKKLKDHLNRKSFLKASANRAATPQLDEEIATLTSFLASPEFFALDSNSPAAQDLTRLLQDSNQKYVTSQQLEAVAQDLEAEADKAAASAIEARGKAIQAKQELEKTDQAIIDKIDDLFGRYYEMSKILPSEKGTVSSNIGRLDT